MIYLIQSCFQHWSNFGHVVGMKSHSRTVDLFSKNLLLLQLVHKCCHSFFWSWDSDCVLWVMTSRDYSWGTLSTSFFPCQTYRFFLEIKNWNVCNLEPLLEALVFYLTLNILRILNSSLYFCFLVSWHGHLLISRVSDQLLSSQMRGVDQKLDLGRWTMAVFHLPTAAIPPGGRLDSLIHLPLQ